MTIRHTTREDLSRVMEIYEAARAYMRANGNPDQWKNGHPAPSLIESDIAAGCSYVVEENGKILAAFACLEGPDPTYAQIEGAWRSDAPYAVVHRLAVDEHRAGIAGKIFDFASTFHGNVRVDTHEANIPMQRALAKWGFSYCGIIHLANGDPRRAYQRER